MAGTKFGPISWEFSLPVSVLHVFNCQKRKDGKLIFIVILIALLIINMIWWNSEKDVRWGMGRGSLEKGTWQILFIAGFSGDMKGLAFDWRFYPNRDGYFDLSICLGVIFLHGDIHWGKWQKVEEEDEDDAETLHTYSSLENK